MTRDFYDNTGLRGLSLSLTGWPLVAGIFAVGFILGAFLL